MSLGPLHLSPFHLSWLQCLLITAALGFIALLPISRKIALIYARLTVLLFIAAVMLAPFAWLICAAFKDRSVLMSNMFLPPLSQINGDTINLNSFRTLFAARQSVQGPVSFWRYIGNSIFLASAGTFLSLVFNSMGGYALAKYRFRGQIPLITFMLASMAIPGVIFFAPTMEIIWRIGWMDTYKALLIPAAAGAFGCFLFRQAMLNVPDELIEAGRLDGCGEFRIYFHLAMPLVRPMTGAFCLITFLGFWNNFLGPNIFLQTQSKLTLPVVLNQYVSLYQQDYGVFLAGTLLAIIPPAILFIALQKEFISGLTSGAVKR